MDKEEQLNKKELELQKRLENISNMEKEIEKTKMAIEREESKIRRIDCNKDIMPEEIQVLINNGTLRQWGKYPHIMFVEGVDKARIIWDDKKKLVMHKFRSTKKLHAEGA